MVKYFSEEFFKEVESRLAADPKWQLDTKGIRTTILVNATDQPTPFLVKVEDGTTTITPVTAPGVAPEFSFEGPLDVWTKIAKGEVDLQSAVLKGLLKFRGSITKILTYRDRFVRLAEVIRSVPIEVQGDDDGSGVAGASTKT
jgi:putative sterol carrier protein